VEGGLPHGRPQREGCGEEVDFRGAGAGHYPLSEFWSDSYRGHTIATLNRGNGWLVYLDHVLQHNKLFVTAEAAVIWLRCQIDTAAAPSRAH
jgi:hypothetical protein